MLPSVGLPASKYFLNDIVPCVVSHVYNERRIGIKECEYQLREGETRPSQDWVIADPHPNAKEKIYTLRVDGNWREYGVPTKLAGHLVKIGKANCYYCWEF